MNLQSAILADIGMENEVNRRLNGDPSGRWVTRLGREIKADMLREAYCGSYYTITGCGGDIAEWMDGYTKWLKDEGIGTILRFCIIHGKDMNIEFGLTGTNRYPDDLTFLAFPLTGLNVSKLALFKLRMGDRWFDDIVDNNLRREREKSE